MYYAYFSIFFMQIISTNKAPSAIGPYNQAIKANGFIFCSGQISLTADGDLINGDVESQTVQVLDNLKAVLVESGSSFDKVVKATIFLSNMDDFEKVNEVYGKYFTDHKPARACVEVSRLPKDMNVEIEMIALEK